MYPEHYGAGWLTQQQVLQQQKGRSSFTLVKVADFLHFWRVNGWYLGVKDENNAALDVSYLFMLIRIFIFSTSMFLQSVEETREMAKMVLERILKPCMC